MSNDLVVQEEKMAQAVLVKIGEYFRDAIHATELRKDNGRLTGEVESLKKQKEELELEIGLLKEARAVSLRDLDSAKRSIDNLQSDLWRLQHSFDTIKGVVDSVSGRNNRLVA